MLEIPRWEASEDDWIAWIDSFAPWRTPVHPNLFDAIRVGMPKIIAWQVPVVFEVARAVGPMQHRPLAVQVAKQMLLRGWKAVRSQSRPRRPEAMQPDLFGSGKSDGSDSGSGYGRA
jgi:hypothetical protein